MKNKDVGLMWASVMAVYGQVGVFFGVYNTIMLIGVFYATTIKDFIPLPLYLLGTILLFLVAILFIIKVGISGYYRFFNKQSAVAEIERKVDLICRELKIDSDKR